MSGRDDEDLTYTPPGAEPVDGDQDMDTYDGLPKGMTWWGRAMRKQERRDDRADDRIERAHQREVDGLHRMIKFQWLLVALLVAAVVVLAGRLVWVELPDGTKIGGSTVEVSAP